jgi:hypothetical protein
VHCTPWCASPASFHGHTSVPSAAWSDIELLTYRFNWGEDGVMYVTLNGRTRSLSVAWTDVAPMDPFVATAAGRAALQLEEQRLKHPSGGHHLQRKIRRTFRPLRRTQRGMSAAVQRGIFDDALEPYNPPHVPVIDELGYQSYAADVAHVLFRVISDT